MTWIGAMLLAALALAAEPITPPANFTRGRVYLPAKVNEAGPYTFLLDTACTIPTVHPSVADELKLASRGIVRIQGIAGVERAPTYPNVTIDLGGGASYAPRRIAAIPSEREQSRRARDGVIGSGFFERFVVEIDGPAQALRLYSPTNYSYSGRGAVLPFRFEAEIPVLKGALAFPGAPPIDAEFEIDTGCDSGVCLGDHFVKAHDLLGKTQGAADQKFGVGGSTPTRNAVLPSLRLGEFEVTNAQADLFLDGSPVDPPRAGHVGMGVFRRHKVIFDYPRKRMIIERGD